MKSPQIAGEPDYLFLELLDRYVRRVADKCDIPEIRDKKEVINSIDLSTLSPAEQEGFENWLARNFYMRISIENALRRGMLVTVQLSAGKAAYSVNIAG